MLCGSCKQEKNENCFYFCAAKGRFQTYCKPCLYTFQKQRWKDRKLKVIEIMGGKCFLCNYKKNVAALELHHLDPVQKDYQWTQLRQMKWETIMEEIQKCQLLCANCHREQHYPEETDFTVKNFDEQALVNRELISSGACPHCNKPVYGTRYCSVTCSGLSKRKTKRPSPEQLLKEIQEHPFTTIAKKYNVTDNCVRKWCNITGIDWKNKTLIFPEGVKPSPNL